MEKETQTEMSLLLKWFSFLNKRQEVYFLRLLLIIVFFGSWMTFIFIPIVGAFFFLAVIAIYLVSRKASKELDEKYQDLKPILDDFEQKPLIEREEPEQSNFFKDFINALRPKR